MRGILQSTGMYTAPRVHEGTDGEPGGSTAYSDAYQLIGWHRNILLAGTSTGAPRVLRSRLTSRRLCPRNCRRRHPRCHSLARSSFKLLQHIHPPPVHGPLGSLHRLNVRELSPARRNRCLGWVGRKFRVTPSLLHCWCSYSCILAYTAHSDPRGAKKWSCRVSIPVPPPC